MDPLTLRFRVWELSSAYPEGATFDVDFRGLNTIQATKTFEIRIIFAPPDVFKTPYERNSLSELLDLLDIPPEFLTERDQSVSHSFGIKTTRDEGHRTKCTWFHYLCKNIEIDENHPSGRPEIKQVLCTPGPGGVSSPQEDYSYLKSGYALVVMEPEINHSTTNIPRLSQTLVCFGATNSVLTQLQAFISLSSARRQDWEKAKKEPLTFFNLILRGLYLDVDEVIWRLNDVFRHWESALLSMSHFNSELLKGKLSPFSAMHSHAKYCYSLGETVSSLEEVTKNVIELLHAKEDQIGTEEKQEIQQDLSEDLRYHGTLVKSTELRLNTLEKRISNAIELTSNLISQRDSLIMMDDSFHMMMIAVLTALLLPATAIASIVGSNMFSALEDQGWLAMQVNSQFWLWCIIVLPVTVLFVLGNRQLRRRMLGPKGVARWTGWMG